MNNKKLIVTLTISDLKEIIDDVIQKKIDIVKFNTESDLPKLINREQVARYFDISLVTLAKWVKNRVLPRPLKQNSRVYFRKQDILNIVKPKNDEK